MATTSKAYTGLHCTQKLSTPFAAKSAQNSTIQASNMDVNNVIRLLNGMALKFARANNEYRAHQLHTVSIALEIGDQIGEESYTNILYLLGLEPKTETVLFALDFIKNTFHETGRVNPCLS